MTVTRSIRRVGIVFSGGPAPAANAVIHAAAISFLNAGIEVMGFLDGYENLERFDGGCPLVKGRDFICLDMDDVTHIRNEEPIILRTSRANPGKAISSQEDLADPEKNSKLRTVFEAFDCHGIDALVSIGGDDTLKTANYLHKMQSLVPGLPQVSIVHLPKTIDNDYYGIDWTFGFTSAAHFAASEIRNLGADARSTKVWYVLEIMGRKAGWLTYASGIAGEATRIMSVEDFPNGFDLPAVGNHIAELMEARNEDGRGYGVVCIAEGVADLLPEEQRPKDVDEHGNVVLGAAGIGKLLAREAERRYAERTGRSMKVRHKQIGYEVRCAEPIAFDVMLGTQLGVGAYRALVEEGLSGVMVSVEDQLQLRYIPFDDLIDAETFKTRVRFIDPASDFYKLARALEYQQLRHPAPQCE